MISVIVQMCVGALCIVMRAIAYVLSYDFEKVLKRPR